MIRILPQLKHYNNATCSFEFEFENSFIFYILFSNRSFFYRDIRNLIKFNLIHMERKM